MHPLNRADLLRHVQRIRGGGEVELFAFDPDLSVGVRHASNSSVTIAPPFSQAPLLPRARVLGNVHELQRRLTPHHQPTEIAWGWEENHGHVVIFDGRVTSMYMTLDPTPLYLSAEQRRELLEAMPPTDSWTPLPRDVLGEVLWVLRLATNQASVRLRVNRTGSSVVVGYHLRNKRVPMQTYEIPFRELTADTDYEVVLQGNTTERLLRHLKSEAKPLITVTGPDSIVGLRVVSGRGDYNWMINPEPPPTR